MRTLLITALAALTVGAFACAKDSSKPASEPAPEAKTDTTLASAADQGGEAVSCDTPNEASDCGGAKEEAGGCNKWDEAAAAIAKRDVPNSAVWKTLKVSGMTCGGCERRVIAHVGKLDNVVSVEADSELGQVRIAMAADSAKTAEAAHAEILKLGYRVE